MRPVDSFGVHLETSFKAKTNTLFFVEFLILSHLRQVLQQAVSGRQSLDMSQLLKIQVHVVCSQRSDSADFGLSWTCVCPAASVHVQPVRAVPVIPTALLRSLTSPARPPGQNRQKG